MAKKPDSEVKKQSASTENEVDATTATSSEASTIVDAIEKNRILILSSTIAILGLGGFFLVAKQLGKQKHLEAGQAFTTAATARNTEALDKVVSDYQGSVSAGNALLAKADVFIDQGKLKEAIATLEEMAAKYTDHPRHFQAYYMLANIYHKSGDYEKARQNYEKVINLQQDGELTPIARIRLGDLALAEGDAEKARQHYDDSKSLHPGNPFFTMAEARIEKLKVGNPPLVDPPKKPEPETEKKSAEAEAPKPKEPEEVSAEVEVVE